MRDLLKRLAKVPVAVVGDVVVDRYVFGLTTRISREAPVPVVLHDREEVRPGGAANAAVNVVALGARVVLLGVVGKDAAASRLRLAMRNSGVRLAWIVEPGRHTAEKTRILAGAQGTRQQQVLRLDLDPRTPPSPRSIQALERALRAAVKAGARAVLLSDYGGGLMETSLVGTAAQLAAQGIVVVVDSRYGLRHARGPFVLKPNAPELAELAGLPAETGAQVAAAGTKVMRKLGAVAVVATRGRDGMVVLQRGHAPVELRAHGSGEVTDVTGAGDTVAAALVTALAAGVPLADAARLANVAASVVVQKLGAATATPQEILHALELS